MGNNQYFGTELDNVYTYGFNLEGTGGSTFTGTVAYTYYGAQMPGQAVYYLGSNYENFGVQGTLCTTKPTDWHEFLNASGPVYPNTNWNALNKIVGNDQVCYADSTTGGDNIPVLSSNIFTAAADYTTYFDATYPTFSGYMQMVGGANLQGDLFADAPIFMDSTGTAISGTNYNSQIFNWGASAWTGAATNVGYSAKIALGTGTNPTTSLAFSHTQTSTGAASYSFDAPVTATGVTVSGTGPGSINLSPYSAAGTPLPTCTSGIVNTQAIVSDHNATPTFWASYTSGGSNTAPVICAYNGSAYAWHIY